MMNQNVKQKLNLGSGSNFSFYSQEDQILIAPWQIFKRIRKISATNTLKKEVEAGRA